MRVLTFALFAMGCAVMLSANGCGKKEPIAASAQRDQGSASAERPRAAADQVPGQAAADPNSPAVFATMPRPANAPVIPIVLSDPGNVEKTLADLTQALRKYSFENRRMQKTFSEVVAAGYVQPVPQPPPNKKFEIAQKTKRVILMNQ